MKTTPKAGGDRYSALRSALSRDDFSQGKVTFAAFAVDVAMLLAELDALKAKQVADVGEVMRLADEWVVEAIHAALAAHTGHDTLADPDAAREALRSHLAKDRT